MKRLRIILPAAGLVLLTALFFLLPVVWRQRTARTAAKAQVRSVALTEPAALTPEEIADLISVASDIDGKVQVTTLDAPVREPQYYLDTVTAMLEQICGSPEQSELVAFLEKECLQSADRIIAFAEYLLVVLEDTPHLLTVVTVQSGDLHMLYEESTACRYGSSTSATTGRTPACCSMTKRKNGSAPFIIPTTWRIDCTSRR